MTVWKLYAYWQDQTPVAARMLLGPGVNAIMQRTN